ncbi:hypothetical protein BDQ17DRAFT_1367367 [Cyathus striatus]|nr:hypothetical protein BDQ17DRAFT_1367367 [Cyathus striatus]
MHGVCCRIAVVLLALLRLPVEVLVCVEWERVKESVGRHQKVKKGRNLCNATTPKLSYSQIDIPSSPISPPPHQA